MDSCELNRDQVEPGAHDITIVGTGQLLVIDENGTEVLAAETDGQGAAHLVTDEQTYTFTCIADGTEGEATLNSRS